LPLGWCLWLPVSPLIWLTPATPYAQMLLALVLLRTGDIAVITPRSRLYPQCRAEGADWQRGRSQSCRIREQL
jgi:hypothetical protein